MPQLILPKLSLKGKKIKTERGGDGYILYTAEERMVTAPSLSEIEQARVQY